MSDTPEVTVETEQIPTPEEMKTKATVVVDEDVVGNTEQDFLPKLVDHE